MLNLLNYFWMVSEGMLLKSILPAQVFSPQPPFDLLALLRGQRYQSILSCFSIGGDCTVSGGVHSFSASLPSQRDRGTKREDPPPTYVAGCLFPGHLSPENMSSLTMALPSVSKAFPLHLPQRPMNPLPSSSGRTPLMPPSPCPHLQSNLRMGRRST